MAEDRLHNSRARAARADVLVNDELLTEAFDKLRAQYIEAMLSFPPDDPKTKTFHIAANQLEKVRQHLKKVIADGKLADVELQQLIESQERRKRFGII